MGHVRGPGARDRISGVLRGLRAALAEHLDLEEKAVLPLIHEHLTVLVAVGAVRFDSGRPAQILWFYFGLTAWSTVRELGWTWADGARWLADQAAAALLTD